MNRSSTVGMPSFRTPSVRLRDFHPPYRLRLVGPAQQLFPDGWPMLFQVVREFADGHPVDARTTLIGLHLPQCFLQVFSLTYFLHQSIRAGWAFGLIHRPGRFSLFPSCSRGLHPLAQKRSPVPSGYSAACRPEIHVLLASPFVRAFSHRSRLGLSVAPPFGIGVPH